MLHRGAHGNAEPTPSDGGALTLDGWWLLGGHLEKSTPAGITPNECLHHAQRG
jgi:hypothetical protein